MKQCGWLGSAYGTTISTHDSRHATGRPSYWSACSTAPSRALKPIVHVHRCHASAPSSPSEKPAPEGCTADSGGSGGREPSSRGKAISGSRGGSGVRAKSRKSTTAGFGAAQRSIFISMPSSGRAYKLSPGTSCTYSIGIASRRRASSSALYQPAHHASTRTCAGSMPRAAHAARNGACASTVASTSSYSSPTIGGCTRGTWWRLGGAPPAATATSPTYTRWRAGSAQTTRARRANADQSPWSSAASLSDVLAASCKSISKKRSLVPAHAWACCEACSSSAGESVRSG